MCPAIYIHADSCRPVSHSMKIFKKISGCHIVCPSRYQNIPAAHYWAENKHRNPQKSRPDLESPAVLPAAGFCKHENYLSQFRPSEPPPAESAFWKSADFLRCWWTGLLKSAVWGQFLFYQSIIHPLCLADRLVAALSAGQYAERLRIFRQVGICPTHAVFPERRWARFCFICAPNTII